VLTRSDVGLLVYDESTEAQMPGSRLKTPSLPVWVSYASGHYGVLFNTNRDLLRDYHAERRYIFYKTTFMLTQFKYSIKIKQYNLFTFFFVCVGEMQKIKLHFT
jgi:hypothetical protein